jgi:hypothetical protein
MPLQSGLPVVRAVIPLQIDENGLVDGQRVVFVWRWRIVLIRRERKSVVALSALPLI